MGHMWILLSNVVWYFQTIDVWQNVPPARIQESTDLKLVAERRSTTLRWSQSSLMVITNNFCFHVSSQKCLQIGQDYGCPLALQMGLWRTGGSWQGSWWSYSSLRVITDNFCFHVSSQKCLQIGQDYECPLALQMGLWRTGGSWQGSWWS